MQPTDSARADKVVGPCLVARRCESAVVGSRRAVARHKVVSILHSSL
jgi:hypothetical protein